MVRFERFTAILWLAIFACRSLSLAPALRLLGYLHGRNEALNITVPAPIKGIYINLRDAGSPDIAVVAAADAGYNVIYTRWVLSHAAVNPQSLLHPHSDGLHFAAAFSCRLLALWIRRWRGRGSMHL
jgi:hypothetical protein